MTVVIAGKRVPVSGLTRYPLAPIKNERQYAMIELTRLNGHKIAVNCDLIRYAETSPDTVLTLVTGEKLLVRESRDEVCRLAFEFRVNTMRSAWPDITAALGARAAFDAVQAEHQPFFAHD